MIRDFEFRYNDPRIISLGMMPTLHNPSRINQSGMCSVGNGHVLKVGGQNAYSNVETIEHLGSGTYGDVFMVQDLQTKALAALKQFRVLSNQGNPGEATYSSRLETARREIRFLQHNKHVRNIRHLPRPTLT